MSCRVLIVDLNNFARYPTIAIGYLASILRARGMSVTVFSPLAYGVPGVPREPRETALRNVGRRLSYSVRGAQGAPLRYLRRGFDRARSVLASRKNTRITDALARTRVEDFDVVLVSTYLMYYEVCAAIGERCRTAGVPLLVGGSYFANREVARAWLCLPGLSGLIGGEVELELPALVQAAASRADLSNFSGVWLPDGRGEARAPLTELDAIPFPDYSDFPWRAYPNRIIPLITGRGCGWGVCSFCSDVTSTAGRSFRSRSLHNVLDEIGHQSRKHTTSLFVFTDLKLNSEPEMWHGLIEDIARRARQPQWIAAVHVARHQHHLDRETLFAARRAGLVRVTTGLESGSQRLLDALRKGTELSVTSRFLQEASAAGISVRVTMMHGAPGESETDVQQSAEFLERHLAQIDRVSLNRFQILIGPTFLERYTATPERFPDVHNVRREPRSAQAQHEHVRRHPAAYARATQRLLRAVHAINRKPLGNDASSFDGVM